jgi:cysteinylglycine-S-conjugate dipeptidase
VSDLLWARPALTVLGIDVPPVVGSSAAIQPKARARLNLRVPPGMDAKEAQDALVAHLEAVAPWNVKVSIEREAFGQPFTGSTTGPAYETLTGAMHDAYGRDSTTEGQGGSIPLCNVFREAYPDAEIMLLGVEEPKCLIHAPNESVDPTEIENMAVTEALFLQRYADAKGAS